MDTCLPAGREHQIGMMWYVYVLRSKETDRFYTGMTSDLERRLAEHNSGKTKSSKGYRPWDLFFSEEFETMEEARKRELYLKSGSGREFVKDKWTRSLIG